MASALKFTWTVARSLLARNSLQCNNCSVIHQQAQRSLRSLSGLTGVLIHRTVREAPAFQNRCVSQQRNVSTGLISHQRTCVPPSNHSLLKSSSLLKQTCTPLLMQTRGMKLKGKLKRRCKSCLIVKRKDNMYVICDEHPRHKQKLIKQKKWSLPGVWRNKWY